MWHDVVCHADACPWLSYETVDHASDLMYRFRMQGGGCNKALFKPSGFCRTLAEIHWTDSIIFGNRFAVWGWSDTPAVARALLADAERLNKLPKPLREEASLHEWIDKFLRQSETDDWCSDSQDCSPTTEPKYPRFPKAPGVFELMKWKSNEFVADGLKWRDIVSFAGHPLQAWSRVVSRCLHMLVNHLTDQGTGLSFAKMQGVRDQIHAAVRMGGNPRSLSLKEEDMTDMFWEIPSTEVKSALSWALSEVGKSARSKCLSFSVSKESKALDRLGKASTKGFVIVSQDALESFVSFDLFDNILFTAGAVILQQNGKGVPIGGFISAQAAELWAMWKEARLTSEESRSALTSEWNAVLAKPPKDWAELQSPQPLLPVSATLMGATDFTMAPQAAATMTQHGALMTHASPHLVLAQVLHERGFRGWLEPVDADRLLGTVSVLGTEVFLVATNPWDGSAKGHLHTIVKHTPPRNRGKVGEFLKCFDPLQGVVGEVLGPPVLSSGDSGTAPLPLVLLSRYRDNLYIVFANLPDHLLSHVQFAVASLLPTIYGIPLKWEPHGDVVT